MEKIQLDKDECHSYYQNYIAKSSDINIVSGLENDKTNLAKFIEVLPDSKWKYAYAPEKWSIAEVIQHIIDTERIFCYRALRFARKDQTPIPGFEQDDYVRYSGANEIDKKQMTEDLMAVRQGSITLFQSLTSSQLLLKGTASNSPMSVRAIGYILSGHQNHHLQILKERYL